MEDTKHECSVSESAKEEISDGDVDRNAEADEEKGDDDDSKGRSADNRYIGQSDQGLTQPEELGSTKFGSQDV